MHDGNHEFKCVGEFHGSGGNGAQHASGPGNLRLKGYVNVNAPLAHQGSLTIDQAQLNTANSYTGDTFVDGGNGAQHECGGRKRRAQ